MSHNRNHTIKEMIAYYDYIRDEIKREDELTYKRTTTLLTFQGFLINAMALMLVFAWKDLAPEIVALRALALVAIGFVGLIVGVVALDGILAATASLKAVTKDWKAKDKIWKVYLIYVPQAFGQGRSFNAGALSATRTPLLFVIMWALYLCACLGSVWYFRYYPVQPINTGP